MTGRGQRPHYVICVSNDDYPASLERRKAYQALPDAAASARGFVRVIDESDEDYLYPQELFVPIELPPVAQTVFAQAS